MKLIYHGIFVRCDTFLFWEVVHPLPNDVCSYWTSAPLCQREAFFSFLNSYQPIQRTQCFDQDHKQVCKQSWKWMQEFSFQVLHLPQKNPAICTTDYLSSKWRYQMPTCRPGLAGKLLVLVTEVADALHMNLRCFKSLKCYSFKLCWCTQCLLLPCSRTWISLFSKVLIDETLQRPLWEEKLSLLVGLAAKIS